MREPLCSDLAAPMSHRAQYSANKVTRSLHYCRDSQMSYQAHLRLAGLGPPYFSVCQFRETSHLAWQNTAFVLGVLAKHRSLEYGMPVTCQTDAGQMPRSEELSQASSNRMSQQSQRNELEDAANLICQYPSATIYIYPCQGISGDIPRSPPSASNAVA